MLTAERLREVLHYDPETGAWTWRVSPCPGVKVGQIAGTVNNRGRRVITIDGTDHLSSRLAWLYMTGAWPSKQIDHRNRVRTDDRWANLREATQTQNNGNMRRRSDNTSGIKGVCWDKDDQKWRVRIGLNGQRKHLGRFSTLDEAAAAYARAANDNFGEFACAG